MQYVCLDFLTSFIFVKNLLNLSVFDKSWEHITYEDATSHAYVSGEDGLLGVSDRFQLLCASLALWNGKDTILKERLFGLTSVEVQSFLSVDCYVQFWLCRVLIDNSK